MVTSERNEGLTKVGSGSPSEKIRRFCHSVALSTVLVENVPLRKVCPIGVDG
jgi:hypothetical protein